MRRWVGWNRKRGQGMTEYIIVVALIAILSIAVVTIFGNQIREMFSHSTEKLTGGNEQRRDFSDEAAGEVQKDFSDF